MGLNLSLSLDQLQVSLSDQPLDEVVPRWQAIQTQLSDAKQVYAAQCEQLAQSLGLVGAEQKFKVVTESLKQRILASGEQSEFWTVKPEGSISVVATTDESLAIQELKDIGCNEFVKVDESLRRVELQKLKPATFNGESAVPIKIYKNGAVVSLQHLMFQIKPTVTIEKEKN